MRRLLFFALLLVCTATASAQQDPEYRAEIGGGVALVAYQGDLNGSITDNMQPAGSVLAKYRFNPRMALALGVTVGTLKGTSANTKTWYPELRDSTVEFSNSLVDAGLRFEYNFWPYGTGREYYGARHFTPFVTMGLGMTFVKAQGGTVVATNVPIGVGLKYKLGERLNVALEWVMHFALSDKLDGVTDPYGIKSGGMFKNTDSYSALQLSLTYDIWAKCRTCHNDR